MVNSIQQVGLGVQNKEYVLNWFARVLGFRSVIFNEAGEASLMTPYTGGEVCQRDAAFVLNSHGGSGLEVWQHTSRAPLPQPENLSLYNTGLLICKLKCSQIEELYKRLVAECEREPSLQLIGEVCRRPSGEQTCYFSVFGAWFQLLESGSFFSRAEGGENGFCAGVAGLTIGVSNMENSLNFYRKVLGYGHIVQDQENDAWQDWAGFVARDKNNKGKFRRILLQRSSEGKGIFDALFGQSEIELIEANTNLLKDSQQFIKNLYGKGRHIYTGRYWGDLGFIHLCFDVSNMDELKSYCEAAGCPFTVDSDGAFAMGKTANGRFAYLEDPDGSLIEFVETYRIPIWGKFGLNVKGRVKSLPQWLLKIAARDTHL